MIQKDNAYQESIKKVMEKDPKTSQQEMLDHLEMYKASCAYNIMPHLCEEWCPNYKNCTRVFANLCELIKNV